MEELKINQDKYLNLLQKVEERLKEHVFEYKKLLLLFNTGTLFISLNVLSLIDTDPTKIQKILIIGCWSFSIIPLFIALVVTLLEVNGHRQMFRSLLKKKPYSLSKQEDRYTLLLSNISVLLTILACVILFSLSVTLLI